MHVVVVGGGIYGQTLSWRLAKGGARVTQLEPLGPANALSGSGDKSRIVRALYGHGPFADTGAASLPLWEAWGRELGVTLVDLRGVLYLEHERRGPADDAFRAYVDGGLAHLARLGRAVEVLAPEEIAKRWPGIHPAGLARGAFEPGAGIGFVSRATKAFARAAVATGRVRVVAAAAERVETAGGRVVGVVSSGGERIEADHVVVAAALGGVALVEALVGARLGVVAVPHFVSYWDVPWPEGRSLTSDALPPFAELGTGLYGFPDDGENGFKVAWHEPVREATGIDPSRHHLPPSDEELERLRAAAEKRFPALRAARVRGTYQCRYDSTPDENFQIGEVPGVPGLTFVGGMSGHGFKHAPAIGDAVATTLLGGRSAVDLSTFAVRLEPRA
jgi:glycine/D-amino acid oxidase-like deaminating enzyme